MTISVEDQFPSDATVNPVIHQTGGVQSYLDYLAGGGGTRGEEDLSMSTSTTTTAGDETPPENLLSDNKSSASEILLETTSSTSTTMSADTDDTSTTMNTRGSGGSSPNHDLENPNSPQQSEDQDGGGMNSPATSRPAIISFPIAEMVRLDEMISNPRWVVPVLPGGQLEVLLDASIDLAKRDLDSKCEPCQRFIRDGLTISFNKILTDDAVSSWKPEIHKCILKNSERLVDLIVIKLEQDSLSLLDLMGILFNPANKFHTHNSSRQPETFSPDNPLCDDDLFSRPSEMRLCKGKIAVIFSLIQ